jgi:hypothetical protein
MLRQCLLGLEDQFRILEVQRVDVSSVKMITEQTGRGMPMSGVLSSKEQRGRCRISPTRFGADTRSSALSKVRYNVLRRPR